MKLSVAEKIEIVRKRKGMTLGDLAEASGQSRQNLSNKMRRDNFTISDIVKLSEALGCQVEIIFTLPDNTNV